MDSFKKSSEKRSNTSSSMNSNNSNNFNNSNNANITNIGQVDDNNTSNFKDLKLRSISAFVMLSALALILNLGPLYCCILVIILITIIFTELINNSRYQDRNNEIKNYHFVCYFIFVVFMYFFNGLMIFHKFKQDNTQDNTKSLLIKVR